MTPNPATSLKNLMFNFKLSSFLHLFSQPLTPDCTADPVLFLALVLLQEMKSQQKFHGALGFFCVFFKSFCMKSTFPLFVIKGDWICSRIFTSPSNSETFRHIPPYAVGWKRYCSVLQWASWQLAALHICNQSKGPCNFL